VKGHSFRGAIAAEGKSPSLLPQRSAEEEMSFFFAARLRSAAAFGRVECRLYQISTAQLKLCPFT
jgi:hypothetical protein